VAVEVVILKGLVIVVFLILGLRNPTLREVRL
jgi:hypothetical protein